MSETSAHFQSVNSAGLMYAAFQINAIYDFSGITTESCDFYNSF